MNECNKANTTFSHNFSAIFDKSEYKWCEVEGRCINDVDDMVFAKFEDDDIIEIMRKQENKTAKRKKKLQKKEIMLALLLETPQTVNDDG